MRYTQFFFVTILIAISTICSGNAAASDTIAVPIPDTVSDIDGNVYHTITIGTQTWTVENLKTTRYNDGTPIPLVSCPAEWADRSAFAYCWFNNDSTTKDTYGALYNWYAVNKKKLAPIGWRVPTDMDWITLQNYLIAHDINWDGTKADSATIAKARQADLDRSTDTTSSVINNNVSNITRNGFMTLPGGYRLVNGYFSFIGNNGYWWSATGNVAANTFRSNLFCDYGSLSRFKYRRCCGFPVRLLKGN